MQSNYNLGPKDFLRQKFKEINILTVASQYIFENVMYVKKNINNFTKIGDFHNINTRNKHNLGAPVTRLHRIRNLWDNVNAFTIGSQKTSENFLYHDLKKL